MHVQVHSGLAADLPPDAFVVGRVWLPAALDRAGVGGPTVVAIRQDGVLDLSEHVATMADLLDRPDRHALAAEPGLRLLAPLERVRAGSLAAAARGDLRHITDPSWLSPIDLQVIKACGVTFAVSAIERVIEERAKGDAAVAAAVRARLTEALGGDLRSIHPGSEAAAALKARLIDDGLWSAYLEVAIGPDAEVFTKAPVLSSVGTYAGVGVRGASNWNNSEPEAVLVMDRRNAIVGVTLGNDMNLRDVEGRSALLLGEAKDANASCAIGPWIRLVDGPDGFTLDDLLATDVRLTIDGSDGFHLEGANRLAEISRHPHALVEQAGGPSHAYPDGYALFLGTMFVPTADRRQPGGGFTHLPGDVVSISTPAIGTLTNTVGIAEALPRWSFGIRELTANVVARGLIAPGGIR